jgi:hypothetical protein
MGENRDLLIRSARVLGDLVDELVFVGGCATELLITDPAAAGVRPTFDVDVIAETASGSEYYQLGERLRSRGFEEGRDLICRWRGPDDLVLDVMPIDPRILGFSNPWYSGAVESATLYEIAEGLSIRLVSPSYFCATKLAAFRGRGNNDFMISHDLEDFLTVVDGRPELIEEIRTTSPEVRHYLSTEVQALLAESSFIDALPGYLPPDSASQARIHILLARLREVADLDTD